jgi:hypothetical protein
MGIDRRRFEFYQEREIESIMPSGREEAALFLVQTSSHALARSGSYSIFVVLSPGCRTT